MRNWVPYVDLLMLNDEGGRAVAHPQHQTQLSSLMHSPRWSSQAPRGIERDEPDDDRGQGFVLRAGRDWIELQPSDD